MTNKVKNTKKSVMSKKVSNVSDIIKYAKVLDNICDQYEQLWDDESERSNLLFQLCCGMDWNDIMDENADYKHFISYIKDKFYTKIEKKRTQFLELWDFDPSESVEEQFHMDLADGWLVNQIEDYMIATYK
jgi:hypothetical protein